MESFVLVVHVLVAVAITGLILLQHGKGADMGASFGAGASQTVFGAAGSVGLLAKITAVLAAIFFTTSLGLAIYARQNADSALPGLPAAVIEQMGDLPMAPATPGAPAGNDVPAVPAR